MKVKLTYFKSTGKYYADGEFETSATTFLDILTEVKALQKDGSLPGLIDDVREFMIYINPTLADGVPHIVMPIP